MFKAIKYLIRYNYYKKKKILTAISITRWMKVIFFRFITIKSNVHIFNNYSSLKQKLGNLTYKQSYLTKFNYYLL